MIVISTETDKSQSTILDQAILFFCKKSGLQITEQSPCCLLLGELYQNYILITLTQKEKLIDVTIESREYEALAKEFIAKLSN